MGFVIRKDNGSNNSLFFSCLMGLSDGAFFMIKHTQLPNGNHPISIPICPMAVADTLEHCCTYYNIDLQQGSIHSHEQYKTRKLKYKTHSLGDFICTLSSPFSNSIALIQLHIISLYLKNVGKETFFNPIPTRFCHLIYCCGD